MKRSDAIVAADQAASVIFGGQWIPLLNSPDEIGANALAQFVETMGEAPPEAAYRFAVGADVEIRPWSEVNEKLRTALEVFCATYRVLLVIVKAKEAAAPPPPRPPVPEAMGERVMDERVDGSGDRVEMRRKQQLVEMRRKQQLVKAREGEPLPVAVMGDDELLDELGKLDERRSPDERARVADITAEIDRRTTNAGPT